MKRIHAVICENRTVKVFRDSEWQEYRCRLYVDGTLNPDADYFTTDRADAIQTAELMVTNHLRAFSAAAANT